MSDGLEMYTFEVRTLVRPLMDCLSVVNALQMGNGQLLMNGAHDCPGEDRTNEMLSMRYDHWGTLNEMLPRRCQQAPGKLNLLNPLVESLIETLYHSLSNEIFRIELPLCSSLREAAYLDRDSPRILSKLSPEPSNIETLPNKNNDLQPGSEALWAVQITWTVLIGFQWKPTL